jgi:hypothetical protein
MDDQRLSGRPVPLSCKMAGRKKGGTGMQSTAKTKVDDNRHVKEYLKYYIHFPHSPQYAVLLDGPWGIGKTFVVKKCLNEHFDDPTKYVYVSLYGLTSIEDIDCALYYAKYPALASKAAQLAGRGIKTALKFFRADPELKLGHVFNKYDSALYVFDDLERCGLSFDSVLGYINTFVEHHGRKVIVIANEQPLLKDQKYRERREKLIGKTLIVQSSFEEALIYFTSQVNSRARKLYEEKSKEISLIYHQAGLNNLRILQQTMWDFERFLEVVRDEHRSNDDAIVTLLRLFFALSFELRAGRIQAKDLVSRYNQIIIGQMGTRGDSEPVPLAIANQRYPEIELYDTVLSDRVLEDVLIKGIVDGDEIYSSLAQSSYFTRPEDVPDWRIVWHYFERSDEEVDRAYTSMEQRFLNREFFVTGELLHVLGLRLWLADNDVSGRSTAEIILESKKYIDDLYQAKRLETLPLDDFANLRYSGHYGLAITGCSSPAFKEVYEYLVSRRNLAYEELFPSQAKDLLKELEVDVDLFFRRINITNSEDSIYYRVPLLASIDPDIFISTLLKLHPKKQRVALMALKSRYEGGRLSRELIAEKPWRQAVKDRLVEAAGSMAPIGKFRLMKNVEWNLSDE